jgi:chromosome partitioning protein
MRSIAVINHKGGVGKTTIASNLGHALALAGHRVTLVDLDPQGHLTASLGIFRRPARGLAELMLGEASLDQVAIRSRERLTLIPAGERLGELEGWREGGADRARLLARALPGVTAGQAFMLLDCPPAAGLLMVNAVLAADETLIPVTGDYLGLSALAQLMLTLKELQPLRERPLRHWIELSRFLPRRRLAQEVRERLRRHFADHLLGTPVREAAVLAECPGLGRTIFEYRADSRSAEEIGALARDLIEGRAE